MSDLYCNGDVLTPDIEACLRRLLPKGVSARCVGELRRAIAAGGVQPLIFPESKIEVHEDQRINQSLQPLAASYPDSHFDQQGRAIDALTVMSAWEEYLREMARREQDMPSVMLASHDASSDRDATAPQPAISAEALLVLAARVGLFNAQAVVRYPQREAEARVTLHRLERRDYVVRHATPADLDRLCELEKLCWTHSRASRQRIKARVAQYPQGQFVLERAGTVLGVVYSQRIAGVQELEACTAKNVHRLHLPAGSIIQLLALNVDPKAQDSGYGDQLLEFMLQRCSLVPGVDTVVGVTLCKKYDSARQPEFAHYIRQSGAHQDPVLAFHAAHGARIVKPLANYRPEDSANGGNGVLVTYDILNRVRARHEPAARGGLDQRRLRRLVEARVTALLGGDSNAFDPDRPVMEMGLDSADLLKLQQAVEAECGQCLQPGFFFRFNTVNKVIAQLTGPQADDQPDLPADQAVGNRTAHDQPSVSAVAVIGMACRLPGGIDTPDALWEVLANGRSVIDSYPRSRGAWPGADQPGIDRGGFLRDAEAFDASFFRMSPREARITDPQQRILLELAWTCLEEAAIAPAALKGTRTGVFIGASHCDYERLLQESKLEIPAHYAVGCSLAVLANRLSYYFDFCGPSLVVDTACSASLVALHTAIRSLETGECSAALVGGVNLICHPHLSLAYHKAGMLTDDGRCKVFDAAADGYVRSEGAVVMLLKPLSQAIADGDRIHAVIRGSATNHGGLAAGLTVPNPQMQAELLTTAWKRAAVSADELTYLEAHGTGTSLGDPLEMQGMQAAYLQSASPAAGSSCAVGSVKSNLGHLEAAAGIAGLLKVILCMQHGQLPAAVNFSTLNPKIRLDGTPLHVLRGAQAWDARPRIAGVSSFGSGGANAHVVVQEHVTARAAAPARAEEFLFVLSAANRERLTSYATKVADWLRATPTLEIADAIYSWQVGRTAMQERLAIRVRDRHDLLRKLEAWLAGGGTDLWTGQRVASDPGTVSLWLSTYGRELIERALAENALEQLAVLWTSGIEVDWQRRYDGWHEHEKPRRIAVPAYPFARERHWIEAGAADDQAALPESRGSAAPQPLFFREYWTEQPAVRAVAERHANTLVFADAELAAKLAGDGVPEALRQATFVYEADCRADSVEPLRALLARAGGATSAPMHLIYAWARNRGADGVHALFALFNAIRTCGRPVARVTLLGRYDPQCVETCWDYSWIGFQRSLQLHLPHTEISLLFTESAAYPLERLFATDAVTWFREERCYTLALEPVAIDRTSSADEAILRQHGSYLITGGCGSLGFTFARYLAEQCNARLLLVGRRPLDRAIQEQLAALRAAGAEEARYESVDIGDPAALTSWARQLDFSPSGIIHAAGVMATGAFHERTAAQIAEVLQPKTTGCQLLDELFAQSSVDFRCYFSSSSAVLGDFGACDYAVANRFQMAYAHHRAALGSGSGKAVVINWPLWRKTAAGGISAGDAEQTAFYLKSSGQQQLYERAGTRIWHDVMRAGQTQVLAMIGDATRIGQSLARFYTLKQPRPAVPGSAREPRAHASGTTSAESVHAEVRELVAALLQIPAEKLDESTNLADFGFDSILLGQLAEALTARFGVAMTPVLFFSATTIRKVGDHLSANYSEALRNRYDASRAAPEETPPMPALRAPSPAAPAADGAQRIAIVGMAGRFPEAANVDQFWRLLDEGRNAISEIPASRWDWRDYFTAPGAASNRIATNKGGFIAGLAQFDPLFFDISPVEAEEMDPAERLLLMEAYAAIEDAGVSPAALRGRNVGVFVGMEENDDYRAITGRRGVTTAGNAMVSSRLSYFLDLRGPVIATNTACSSGLVALHQAANSLRRQECEAALVAGLSLSIAPSGYLMMTQAGMLSQDGECRSFAAQANGIVVGEAVLALLLKPLSAAIAAGDRIYGCITASGINFDGKTNGVTAPSGERQAELLESVYSQHGIAVEDISHVVCHGTGTRLGDPVEINALDTVFRKLKQDPARGRHCALTSCKGNVGHTLAASGLTSVVGLLKGMQHHRIPASLHCEQESNYIAWQESSFYVNKESRDWIRIGEKPHLGAVSAFGRSGTNAHVVIEEHRPARASRVAREPQVIVPLSARNAERLRHKARDLLSFVASQSIDLHSLAYTLQVGREAMEQRAGFVVSSMEQLAAALHAFIAAQQAPNIFEGQVRHGARQAERQQLVDTWIGERQLSSLAGFWVAGGQLDWDALYAGSAPQRISAPTYPFATERYWIDGTAAEPGLARGGVLHPLLHQNTSDLDAQSYSTTLSGEEFFLKDHQVQRQKVLPGVAYLEMVRAALVHATPAEQREAVVELRNVGWLRPIVVDASTTVTTTLFAGANQVEFEIHSQSGHDDIVHCRGAAAFREPPVPTPLDIAALKSQMTAGRLEAGEVYSAFSNMGLQYGPAHRGIAAIERGDGQLLARLELPGAVAGTAADYVLHPSLLDSALQAAVTLINDSPGPALLPVAIDSISVVATCKSELLAWARHAPPAGQRDKLAKLDVDLCDAQGNVCVQIRGFASLPLESARGTVLAAAVWEASPVAEVVSQTSFSEHHVIFCGMPGDAERLQALLPQSRCRALPAAASPDDIGARYSAAALACFATLQDLVRARGPGKALLQVVVVPRLGNGHGNDDTSLFAGLGGLLKTASLENPRIAGQVVLTEAASNEDLAQQLTQSASRPAETIVRYVRGERQVLRWREHEAAQAVPQIAFKEDGVYLITGGLGGLGVLLAKQILQRAQSARIVLVGRSALSDDGAVKLRSLSGGTGKVTYEQLDVCSSAELDALIAAILKRNGQLNGVIHAAGVIRDNFILKKDSSEFSAVLGPKVLGTVNLDRATAKLDLDFLVLFSSVSAALGNVGQADYAAANGFMDWFAAYRKDLPGRRGRTLSINWPLWRSGGMHIDPAGLRQLSERLGMEPLEDDAGLAAFDHGVHLPQARLLVMQGNVRKIRAALEADGRADETDAIEVSPETQSAVHPAPGDLAERTEEFLRQQFSAVLKLPAARLDPQAPLERYGIDSILAMNLTNQLEKTFGSLSKTLFFEYRTLRELSAYVLKSHAHRLAELFGSVSPGVSADAASAPPLTSRSRGAHQARGRRVHASAVAPASDGFSVPIAIVGLSGRYPQARDLDAYWQNLREGRDCIEEVPAGRWNWREYYSTDRTETGRHYSKWGGFIDGVDEFDPRFFGISPREAAAIDPQERLFLQHCWMATEDAGYTRDALQIARASGLAGQVGVYAGVMYGEYNLSGSLASIANRVSYVLNLHGPSLTLDTMCSSSLSAIHLACQDLKSGHTDLALAGGVNVSIHPSKYSMLSAGHFISSDGHCQSFGEGGDGYIPAEGVGVVVLKRLSDAERDGDSIYGIIRGSALNHGGKTNGYTVPNPQAQAVLIGQVLAAAKVEARDISYIEAHGTGTKLGDPIEIAALARAFQRHTGQTGFCLIGSAKSNIGHGESAAGIAGLTKVLLQMKHRQIVPSLHSRRLNPHIDFANTPFVVNQELTEWRAPVVEGRTRPRIAGISSFGAGGSNAHLIVEEYLSAQNGADAASPPHHSLVGAAGTLIVLSARTAEQLQQKARDLLQFVRHNTPELTSLAFSLQTGREAMAERLGFIASSIEQLTCKLEAHLNDERDIEALYRGQVSLQREGASALMADADFEATVERWVQRQKFDKLLSVWVQGLHVEWRRFWSAPPPRIRLPTYPFAREKYWKDARIAEGTRLQPVISAPAVVSASSAGVPETPPATLAKPTRVALRKPDAALLSAHAAPRQRIRHEPAQTPAVTPQTDASVRLFDRGGGVFLMSVEAANGNPLATNLIARLVQALERARQEPDLKVLMIAGNEQGFLSGDRSACDAAIELGLYRALASFPVPVIACVQGDALGAGFLAAAVCDFLIAGREAKLAYTLEHAGLYPSAAEYLLLRERFGEAAARNFLYQSSSDGAGKPAWAFPRLPRQEVPAFAQRLASTLAAMPRESLHLLKAHLARALSRQVEQLRPRGSAVATHEAREFRLQTAAKCIRLESLPGEVLLISMQPALGAEQAHSALRELTDVFAQLSGGGCRCVVVAGAETVLAAASEDAALELRRRMLEVSAPIVGALQFAAGTAWLISQYFDACVYSETGVYSAARLAPRLSLDAAAIFPSRFGVSLASEILMSGGQYTGGELSRRSGSIVVADAAQLAARAIALANAWSQWPTDALGAWKECTVRQIREQLECVAGPVSEHAPDVTVVSQAAPVALTSNVIRASAHPHGILVVSMEDREAKNRFSDAFIAGMNEVFAHIEATPGYKVVILTGYDSYFASGGTKEALLAIHEGTLKYSDAAVFELPLRCKLPVIAAMQGHGIGAGWSLGMFCDLGLCSEESVYSTRFMSFGFTPGAGTTLIFPHVLGHDLAKAALFTAEETSGSELSARGMPIPVLPRRDVLPAAMRLAEQIASHERGTLIALKRQLSQPVLAQLNDTYIYELAMHEKTFVGQAHALERIHSGYLQAEDTSAPVAAPAPNSGAAHRDSLSAFTASVRKLLADELYLDAAEIDEHAQFFDLGLDSITGVTWIRKINEKFGLSIEATKVYSHPTLAELSRYAMEEAQKRGAFSDEAPPAPVAAPVPMPAPVQPAAAPREIPLGDVMASAKTTKALTSVALAAPAAARASTPAPTPTSEPTRDGMEPIAVVGFAGQFPKAPNLESFWQNIAGGVDCVSAIPKQRWDIDTHYREGAPVAGKSNSKWMGALEEYDLFDPLFFAISPTEAQNMDPQQRLFLQACWNAIEHAGYDARAFSGTHCGVFVGCAAGDYYRDSGNARLNAQELMGNAPSILAARISYFLNLQGPCVCVDTACSSSLVAIADACGSLCAGVSDVALAGGVHVMAGPAMHIMTSQAGMLSPDGRCFTFDARANGFVPAEAVGVVLLKRLADAERDQDVIHGVIRGWGVNQDGKTNGITAPSPLSQTRLQQAVYDKFRIDPSEIQLIEAHGTGTKLGDPIEIEALKASFGKYTRKRGYCAVGSVKSNIGHSLTAAGVSGFIKLMLALQNRKLPPTSNFQRLNEHISLEDSPFYINGELRDWDLHGASQRQAAISSFGFSGTNCHMVVAEHVPAAKPPASAILQNDMIAIALSARTDEQLKQRAADLLSFMGAREELDLLEVAYTLQVGREAMDQRLGFMVSSIGHLAERLREYLDGGRTVEGMHRGQVKHSRESMRVISEDDEVKDTLIEKYLARRQLDKLLQLWVKGLEVDWDKLWARKPRRIAMPGYPFAKERYWLESTDASEGAGSRVASQSVLNPLLHRNTSDFSSQRYTTHLTGSEPFLADHRVRGQKILPGVAYLEMARAALADVCGRQTVGALTLRNVVWSRPLLLDEPRDVRITLHPEGEEVAYQVSSVAQEAGEPVVHCNGRASFGIEPGNSLVDLEQVRARASRSRMSAAKFYHALQAMGLEYGASHQRITGLDIGDTEVLARLSLPADTASSPYILPPGLLDSAFQASLGLRELAGDAALPFALERLDLLAEPSGCTWAWARWAPNATPTDRLRKFDIDLCDEAGEVAVRIRGLSARTLEPGAAEPVAVASGTLWFEPVWVEEPVDVARIEPETPALRFVFLCGFEAIASALQRKVPGTVVPLTTTGSLAEHFEQQALQVFERLQRLIQQKPQDDVLVQVVVPDGHAVHAALTALLKSARLENGRIAGQVIAIHPSATVDEVHARLQQNRHCPGAEHIRYEQDRRLVRRLAEVTPPPATACVWRDDGVYLITGGAGGLGMIFARAIAARVPAATVILTGRSELDQAGQARLQQLQACGLRAEYRRVDVTDAAAVRALISDIHSGCGSLTGILHCAGIIDDAYMAKKTAAQFRAVLAPKILGTQHLDAASQSLRLEFFVLFSSIAGVLGGAGQSDYAVANAFMDAYAGYRNELVAGGSRFGRTLSVNWPLWQSDGMGVDAATEKFFEHHFGMLAMPQQRGIEAFERALCCGKPQVMVMDGLLARMRQRLLGPPVADEPVAPGAGNEPHVEPQVDDDMLLGRILDTLRMKVARYLKIQVDALDFDTELTEFGFDSISLTEFTNQLNNSYALTLTPTVFFEFPTLSSLAAHLRQAHREVFVAALVTPRGSAPEPQPRQNVVPPRRQLLAPIEAGTAAAPHGPPQHDPIAIIGVSGKFPQAETLAKFWENLRNGRDCIEEIPESRWDWRALYGDPRTEENKTNAKWGGFIDGIDEFDPLFFGISPREAQLMDPQQRLLMTYVWKVIESSGYSSESLSGSSTGLFVGTHSSGYQELATQAGIAIEAYSSTGMSTSVGPNRMSYFLNLHGPSEPIETACSSSLVAIHRAVEAIQSGSCEAAIAGGVNTIVSPWMHISFSKAGMLCEDGRCKTFSDRANGYVRGEGVGMLFLKKLSAAERDGDQIHAVIRGSAENHGGRASSLTAPNPKAQASLLEAAYRRAGVDPRTVGYIETHGTGTELGDPIEINALKSAFQSLYGSQGADAATADSHCGLGSLKSNIGHLELAAGVAGVIKVLLQLKHQTRVKTLHCGTINPYIDLSDSPFYIVRDNDGWPRLKDGEGHDLPRRAGVSSFGFGGVNAHVVLEEYVPRNDMPAPVNGPYLIVLSAKTQASLKQAAEQLSQYLDGEGSNTDLGGIAYTLQVGRDSMEQRLALLAHSRQELQEKLRGFLRDEDRVDLYRGEVKRNQDVLAAFAGDEDLRNAVDVWIRKGKYEKLLSLWVKGLICDWSKLYPEVKPARVDLPTYAFAREKVWFETAQRERRHHASRQPPLNALHPLLHINTSNLGEQSYRTHLSGEEFFLRDHRVSIDGVARAVLPAVAHLEMARAAIERAVPESLDMAMLELRGVTWRRPVVVAAPKELTIVLSESGQTIGFEVLSQEAGTETIHCEGHAIVRDALASAKVDLAQLRERMHGARLVPDDVYAALERMGLKYGPAHRPITQVVLGEDELLAELQLPATLEEGRGQFLLHPSLMDGALQAAIGLLPDLTSSSRTLVPFSVESLRVLTICPGEMIAWLRRAESSLSNGTVLTVDIDLLDKDGTVCVSMRGFAARALQPARPETANDAPAFADAFYRQLIERVARQQISIEDAVELG